MFEAWHVVTHVHHAFRVIYSTYTQVFTRKHHIVLNNLYKSNQEVEYGYAGAVVYITSFYFITVLVVFNLIIAMVWEIFTIVREDGVNDDEVEGNAQGTLTKGKLALIKLNLKHGQLCLWIPFQIIAATHENNSEVTHMRRHAPVLSAHRHRI